MEVLHSPPLSPPLSVLNFLLTCHRWTPKEEQVNYQAESGHRCRRSSSNTIKEDPIRVVQHVWQCWGMVFRGGWRGCIWSKGVGMRVESCLLADGWPWSGRDLWALRLIGIWIDGRRDQRVCVGEKLPEEFFSDTTITLSLHAARGGALCACS